jgi:hypothetical protein
VLGVTIKTTAETIYQANDRFGSEAALTTACKVGLLLCWKQIPGATAGAAILAGKVHAPG